mgnify:CR=1 FL=1
MSRKSEFFIEIGTNGVGKSYQMKKFQKINKRNLVLPSNKIDNTWDDNQELKIIEDWKKDPNDYNQKRMKKYFRVPKMQSFKGNKKIFLDFNSKTMFADLFTHDLTSFKNGGLFIDDYKNLIKGHSLKNEVRQLFDNRRHYMLDIFISTHSFQDLTSELLAFSPWFLIFYTTTPVNKNLLDKINNKKGLLDTIKKVNAMAKEDIAKGKKPYRYLPFKPA